MFGDSNLMAIFTTGLLTGGLTCIAVQGGLMTAALAQTEQSVLKINARLNTILPVIAFIFSKLVAYTILGFLLGWAGSLIQVSILVRTVLQFFVAIFMFGTALDLLNIHPIFRYFVIQPPKFLTNLAYKHGEKGNLFSPLLLGFLTVFIPCGATQAMMALSVASGSPILGAVILFVFVLGTSPAFFLLGVLTLKLGAVLKKQFLKIAAFVIILLSLFNLDATLALANSPYTINSLLKSGYCIVSYCSETVQKDPVTEQTIIFTPNGYSPNYFVVNRGTKVKLHLVNENAAGCIQAFTISALNIQKIVLPNQSTDITFTAPDKAGRISFTCSAGLYPGTIEVI